MLALIFCACTRAKGRNRCRILTSIFQLASHCSPPNTGFFAALLHDRTAWLHLRFTSARYLSYSFFPTPE